MRACWLPRPRARSSTAFWIGRSSSGIQATGASGFSGTWRNQMLRVDPAFGLGRTPLAKVYPDVLPDYILRDPLRAAERKVYAALAQQLSDAYVVFYSRPWLGTSPDGTEIDGEADFVVAHPDQGM